MGVFTAVWNRLIPLVPQIVVCVADAIRTAFTITPPAP